MGVESLMRCAVAVVSVLSFTLSACGSDGGSTGSDATACREFVDSARTFTEAKREAQDREPIESDPNDPMSYLDTTHERAQEATAKREQRREALRAGVRSAAVEADSVDLREALIDFAGALWTVDAEGATLRVANLCRDYM